MGEHGETGASSQPQLDDLRAQTAANHADIQALRERADAADERAHAADERAAVAEERAAATEERAAEDRHRIDGLEALTEVDRATIRELQADGVLNREHTANLEIALHSSRLIGAALGIVMATRRVNEVVAFDLLKKASQDKNRKLRVIAEEIVNTGDVSGLRAG